MDKVILSATSEGIGKGLDHIESELEKLHFRRKEIQEAMLLSEESMVRLIASASDGEEMHIAIRNRHGLAAIRISVPGTELSQERSVPVGIDLDGSDMSRGGRGCHPFHAAPRLRRQDTIHT